MMDEIRKPQRRLLDRLLEAEIMIFTLTDRDVIPYEFRVSQPAWLPFLRIRQRHNVRTDLPV